MPYRHGQDRSVAGEGLLVVACRFSQSDLLWGDTWATLATLMFCTDSIKSLFASDTMHLDSTTSSCDLLVLGAGWTWSFLKPLLTESHSSISFIATTRDGRDGTLKWSWDSESDDEQQYYALPRAKTVLIVFPIKGAGASKRLLQGYEAVHGSTVRWIQLGSTGIYDVSLQRLDSIDKG